ncbi:Transcription factor TCP7 [Camellia lanceoleosa]|uniref:Transcription factor TCP7 n=1 Tax=Camellia lanceoleosa TaxID=1840588 RepID=A0ACC0F137_9ERIC|nr:Transcription factor TCP7 [Camellia lanceoleosa]
MTLPSSSKNQPKPKSLKASHCPHKPLKDPHVMVNGQHRRVRLSDKCDERINQLTSRLGHRTKGQTIEWLLYQVQHSINAIFGIDTDLKTSPTPNEAEAMPVLPEITAAMPVLPEITAVSGSGPGPALTSTSTPPCYSNELVTYSELDLAFEEIEKYFGPF